MDDARAAAFLRWMREESRYTASVKSVKGYINALKRVERRETIQLDAEFLRDGLQDLLERYTFEAGDARARVPTIIVRFITFLRTVRMAIELGIKVRDVTRVKSRINQYQQFCVAYPPPRVQAE